MALPGDTPLMQRKRPDILSSKTDGRVAPTRREKAPPAFKTPGGLGQRIIGPVANKKRGR